MALPNSEKITSQIAMLPDAALKQMAMMHKSDPYVLPLIISEDGRRKQLRRAAQAQMGAMPQPKVADAAVAQMGQLPEDQGIAQLPAPNMQRMADGGIAGYGDEEEQSMAMGGMGGAFDFAQRSEPVLRMSGGGMAGYADGGVIAFAKGGKPNTDAFENAFQTVLRLEGGAKYVPDDAGKGPTKYGINQTANPDVDVKNLTEAQARDIYRKRYWNKINGDALAAKNPELAKIAFDAAVNQGTGPANKMVAAADGDPAKLLEMRKQRYDALVQSKPEKYGQFSKGWDKRLASLATAAVPIGSAQAAPSNTDEARRAALISQTPASTNALRTLPDGTKIPTGGSLGAAPFGPSADANARGVQLTSAPAADDAASRIPGQSVQAPAAVAKEPSFMGRQADKLGISEDAQRNISNLANAVGGASGALYIPRYLPKVPGGLATLGERAYEIINPSKQMTAKEIEALRVGSQAERVVDATKTAEMAGALPAEARTAAQAVEAANAAKLAQLPSKAELVQDAAALRQAQEANRLATTGQVTQQAGQVAAGSAVIDDALRPKELAPAGGIPDLAKGSTEDFQRREREARKAEDVMPKEDKKELVKLAKETVPKAERKGLTNDDYLMMGLGLLASKSSDFGQAVGEAGLGVMKSRREREKDEREAESTRIKDKYYGAYADMIERGGKEKSEVQLAEKTAQEAVDNWAKNNKMALLQTPGLYEQMRNKYRMEAYNQYGIPMQNAAGAAGAPTARTGWGVATAS